MLFYIIIGIQIGILMTVVASFIIFNSLKKGIVHVIDFDGDDPELYLQLQKNPRELLFDGYAIFKVKVEKPKSQK